VRLVTFFILFVVWFFSACTETSYPPEASFQTAGLWRDSNGIFIDTVIQEPFADMPVPYRSYYRYCSDCHSQLNPLAQPTKPILNTWQDIVAYGAAKLVMVGKLGPSETHHIPEISQDVLNRAEAYLASWPTGNQDALSGCRFPLATAFATQYCASCHTALGHDADQGKAYKALKLDTYADWQSYQGEIKGRIALDHPGGKIMPPKGIGLQPSDSERQVMLLWLQRGSPNTPDGTGQGDTLPIYPIVTEGAVIGLRYEAMRLILNRSCADCHTRGGMNKDQKDGWNNAIKLDTYPLWLEYAKNIRQRIDTAYAKAQDPPAEIMPKYGFRYPLSDAERQLILDWIDAGSPNTSDGK
jgi:mono/diheme cytochrome c family protein